ncbi:uncharacterized protein LOC126248264 isoform X2 [Schistocerca nitens]|nr:uncharacterized protein LOC126248264 isoform X2 [Schistocerca nitens]
MASEFTTSLLFDDLVQPLCTESTTNDACYGCFALYARMRQVPDAYDELKKCARDYLNDTSYAECQAVLSGPHYPGGFSSPKAYVLYVTDAGELRVMSMYVGANDQFSCEPSPSPLGPIPASATNFL